MNIENGKLVLDISLPRWDVVWPRVSAPRLPALPSLSWGRDTAAAWFGFVSGMGVVVAMVGVVALRPMVTTASPEGGDMTTARDGVLQPTAVVYPRGRMEVAAGGVEGVRGSLQSAEPVVIELASGSHPARRIQQFQLGTPLTIIASNNGRYQYSITSIEQRQQTRRLETSYPSDSILFLIPSLNPVSDQVSVVQARPVR